MYRLSVPIMNATVTEKNREEYLHQCKACQVDRVFLIPDIDIGLGVVRDFDALVGNLAFFESNGMEGAIWVGETIGHGGLTHDVPSQKAQKSFPPLINLNGEPRPGTRCPLDEEFGKSLENIFSKLASSGAKLILIDDDFRLSQHGKESLCCFCDLHMEKINHLCKEKLTREDLKPYILGGKPNPYRNAYLKASGESLENLAKRLRAAVDRVDPSVGLALCSCHCIWDSDGIDPIALTNVFKGNHAPVLRLLGAPYWAIRTDKKMPAVFEIARMMASFCKDTGFELMSECDAYPRPRYHIPASLVELQDALIQADGSYTTTLKYMFDYTSSPFYEKGYVEHHVRDLPLLKKMSAFFSEGKQIGVKNIIRPHLFQDSDWDLITPTMLSPYPTAGILMGYCSIPTTYSGTALCRAAFGQNIQDIPDDDLDGGIILDAASAILLTERGIDVGLNSTLDLRASFKQSVVNRLSSPDGEECAMLLNGECKLLVSELKETSHPLLFCTADGSNYPLCYRYENEKGQRFLVYLFEGMSLHKDSGLLQGYLSQGAAIEGVEWISRKPLPAKIQGHPQLYLLCKQDQGKLTVGLFNCHADRIFAPVITLDQTYSSADYLNTDGTLSGNTLTLSELGAYSFAAVCLKI